MINKEKLVIQQYIKKERHSNTQKWDLNKIISKYHRRFYLENI